MKNNISLRDYIVSLFYLCRYNFHQILMFENEKRDKNVKNIRKNKKMQTFWYLQFYYYNKQLFVFFLVYLQFLYNHFCFVIFRLCIWCFCFILIDLDVSCMGDKILSMT